MARQLPALGDDQDTRQMTALCHGKGLKQPAVSLFDV